MEINGEAAQSGMQVQVMTRHLEYDYRKERYCSSNYRLPGGVGGQGKTWQWKSARILVSTEFEGVAMK